MVGQHAEVAIGGGDLRLAHLLFNERLLGRGHLEEKRVRHRGVLRRSSTRGPSSETQGTAPPALIAGAGIRTAHFCSKARSESVVNSGGDLLSRVLSVKTTTDAKRRGRERPSTWGGDAGVERFRSSAKRLSSSTRVFAATMPPSWRERPTDSVDRKRTEGRRRKQRMLGLIPPVGVSLSRKSP